PASCPAAGGGPGSLLPRHTGGLEGDRVLRPDELAAAYLYAGAADIHCDYAAGGQIAGLPAQWADAPPGYAHADDIGDQEVGDRQLWKDALTNGIIRLFLGLFVSLLALVYYAAHLVFTLALVALWVGIPFGLLFGMFQHDFGWAGEYFKSAFDTLKNSWVTSFIIGLLTAGLIAAAQSGNANVFAGIATGTLVFLIFTFFNALGTLRGALGALTSIAGGVMGGGAQAMGSAMNMAGGAAMGLATGGASTALGAMGGVARAAGAAGRMGTVANAATRESGSRAYGIAAAIGSTGVGMQVGEFARQIGVLRGPGGDAVLDAMRAGHASRTSMRAFNQRVRGSAKTGTTLDQARADAANLAAAKEAAKRQRQADVAAQRADTGQLDQLDQLREGNMAQRGVAAARALPGVIGAGARAAGAATAAARRGLNAATSEDPALAAIGALAAGGSAVGRTVRGGAYRAGVALRSGGRAVARTTGAAARTARRSVDPNDRFAAAWRLGEQGNLQRVDDPEQATPPEGARRSAFSNEELRDQLRAGATVRFHEDRTASLWGGAPPDAPATDPQGEDVPVRDLGTVAGWVQRQADAPPAADAADAPPADGEVPVRMIAPARPSPPPRHAADRPPTRPAPQPAEPPAEPALAVPEATLTAMRAQHPPRPRRIRPAMPAPSGPRPTRTTPSSYFSDVDPSKHFGD
ncbi:hypothetical protein K2Z83_28085, partial [Oscillochloris sp. ZM17-4]|nr:hypothetical protein [Oscillochloris sp. ZM17-4]